MLQAEENKLIRLIDQLEEAGVLLCRSAKTADDLSKTFREILNSKRDEDEKRKSQVS